jgi:hypothetical protein
VADVIGRSGVFIAKLLCGWMRPCVYAAVPLLPALPTKGDPGRTRKETPAGREYFKNLLNVLVLITLLALQTEVILSTIQFL